MSLMEIYVQHVLCVTLPLVYIRGVDRASSSLDKESNARHSKMHALVVLSVMLAVGATTVRRSEDAPILQPTALQSSFREELSRLIETNGKKVEPILHELLSEIQACNAKVYSEVAPCRECLRDSCHPDLAMKMEQSFFLATKRRITKRFLSSWNWSTWKFPTFTTIFNTASDVASSAANTVANTATNAANTVANTATNVWSSISSIFGRSFDGELSMSPEMTQCMETCEVCVPFFMDRETYFINTCSSKMFLQYKAITGPLTILRNLKMNNEEMPILEKVELMKSPESGVPMVHVWARFPAGSMMYMSRVAAMEDNTQLGVELAQEYFDKIRIEFQF